MRVRFLNGEGVPVMMVPAGIEEAFPESDKPCDPDIGVHGIGNVWLVRNHFKKAEQWAPGHHHPHDHLMLLTAGAVEVWANGLITQYEAEHIIIIPKQTRHQIRAKRDGTTIWCIAALRDGETGEVIGMDETVESLQPLTEELATALGKLHAAPSQESD